MAPVERRCQRLDFLERHFVVLVLGIAAQNDLHGGFGQIGFHGQNGLRVRGGLGRHFAAQLEHAGDVFHVLVTNFFRFCIVVQIELAARQRHAGLIKRRESHTGVVKAGLRIDSEKYSLIGGVNKTQVGGPCDLVDRSDDFRKLRLVLDSRDAIEHGLQWLEAGFVDGVLIHAGGVVIADLLLYRSPIGRRLGRIFQRVAHGGNIPDGQRVKRAPSALIGGDRISLHPLAAGVLEKVRAGVEGLVYLLDAEVLEGRHGAGQ